MMKRWGLEGMRSFQQEGVAAKEAVRLADAERSEAVVPASAR
jgi:biotin synthase